MYYSRYGGLVISAAISKYVYISVNRSQVDALIQVKYSKSETVAGLNEVQPELVREAMRLTDLERGLEIVSLADVPAGTGMGSSGSFLLALVRSLHASTASKSCWTCTDRRRALAEQKAPVRQDLRSPHRPVVGDRPGVTGHSAASSWAPAVGEEFSLILPSLATRTKRSDARPWPRKGCREPF